MSRASLGLIETIGLAAAVEAADAAVKSADVELVGYELARGDGMTAVKIRGDVGAVNAAVAAAAAAAERIGRVVSTHVIARPSVGLDGMIDSADTVGRRAPLLPESTAMALPAPAVPYPAEIDTAAPGPIEPAAAAGEATLPPVASAADAPVVGPDVAEPEPEAPSETLAEPVEPAVVAPPPAVIEVVEAPAEPPRPGVEVRRGRRHHPIKR